MKQSDRVSIIEDKLVIIERLIDNIQEQTYAKFSIIESAIANQKAVFSFCAKEKADKNTGLYIAAVLFSLFLGFVIGFSFEYFRNL